MNRSWSQRSLPWSRLEKLPPLVQRCQQMIVEFLGVVQAAHLSFLPAEQLDSLEMPTYRGQQRLAGGSMQAPAPPSRGRILLPEPESIRQSLKSKFSENL